jgi:hypothetical protein
LHGLRGKRFHIASIPVDDATAVLAVGGKGAEAQDPVGDHGPKSESRRNRTVH